MSNSDKTGEMEFDRKDWFHWKNRPIPEHGRNKVRITVKEITNRVPTCKKTRDEWESWKKRACDAGFLPGQELVVLEGKKLVSGKPYCFEGISDIINPIWGMTYDCWFPWCHRDRSGYGIKDSDGAYIELKMNGGCSDLENTVIFDIEKITGSEGNSEE